METFFSEADLAALELLIEAAQQNDLGVLERQAELGTAEEALSFEGRLGEALSVTAGGTFETDLYKQASPSVSISVSVDVMDIINADDETAVIQARTDEAKEAARVKAVEAFVDYKVAVQAAEAAAREVEAAQAAFEVAETRVASGDSILSSQLSAQSEVAAAAISLLRANGDVIVTLERLADATGLTPEQTVAVVGGETLAGNP